MKINLQILHLCAAIFNQDPLQMLVGWSFQTKDQMKETGQRLEKLKGVMPDSILDQVLTFVEELARNRGGPFQFIYTHKPEGLDAALTKWTALISEDASWLNVKLADCGTKP